MLKKCLEKNGKTYYFENSCICKNGLMNKSYCMKYKVIDNHGIHITPLVDYIEVRDGLFYIKDKVRLNENINVNFFFYVNDKGLPVSPCYNDLFPDEMYAFPVTSRKKFVEKYDEIISSITKNYIARLENKFAETEKTCMQLAMKGKDRKHKRVKKSENKV